MRAKLKFSLKNIIYTPIIYTVPLTSSPKTFTYRLWTASVSLVIFDTILPAGILSKNNTSSC